MPTMRGHSDIIATTRCGPSSRSSPCAAIEPPEIVAPSTTRRAATTNAMASPAATQYRSRCERKSRMRSPLASVCVGDRQAHAVIAAMGAASSPDSFADSAAAASSANASTRHHSARVERHNTRIIPIVASTTTSSEVLATLAIASTCSGCVANQTAAASAGTPFTERRSSHHTLNDVASASVSA